MSSSSVDKLFAAPRHLVDFTFDEAVAKVFPDMIRRSVPGYETLIALTGLLAARHAQAGSRIYDLGASLGASTLAVARCLDTPDIHLVAVDNAPAMAARCARHLRACLPQRRPDVICADVRHLPIRDASVVILNFTLQFVPPEDRAALLARIHAGLRPGGVLLLAEKIAFADAGEQARMEALHADFKKANGYSELEISQKRAALEKVLIPDTLETHHDRLRQAGFGVVETWFRCLNFVGLLAQR